MCYTAGKRTVIRSKTKPYKLTALVHRPFVTLVLSLSLPLVHTRESVPMPVTINRPGLIQIERLTRAACTVYYTRVRAKTDLDELFIRYLILCERQRRKPPRGFEKKRKKKQSFRFGRSLYSEPVNNDNNSFNYT